MRKQMILAAFAALGALICSCEREKDVTIAEPVNTDEINLVLGGIATRSASETPIMRVNYELGEVSEGVKLTLEEVVTEMGDLVDDTPETRGTPAYTENVTDVHGNKFNGEIWSASGRVAVDGPFDVIDLSGGRKAWRRALGFDAWKKANGPVSFYLHMPSSPEGLTNLVANYAANSIEFDYVTPESAPKQQDILFGSRKDLSFEDYLNEYKTKGGASVLFRHALTGVKFAIGNNTTKAGNRTPDGEVQTFITKVEITGLKDKGHAKFVPVGTETVQDNKTEFSSAGSFTWTDGSMSPTRTTVYTQTFSNDDIQDFKAGDAVNAAGSFYEAGQNRNLNKADASLTFWFIPQDITSDLQIKVTLKIWSGDSETGPADNGWGEEKELVLKMGDLILAQANDTNKKWKAGQIRTFTLKPNVVDVDIDDEVEGFIKKDVVITNTGNVDAYIRANIVANWMGTTDTGTEGIALGYTTPTREAFVESWELNYGTNPKSDNFGGKFDTLPGAGWVYAKDGFFYYTAVVKPGDPTGTPLFKQYTNSDDNVPAIYYLSSTGVAPFSNVRLVMDLTVQAIEAKAGVAWDDAWGDEKVLGAKPVPVN